MNSGISTKVIVVFLMLLIVFTGTTKAAVPLPSLNIDIKESEAPEDVVYSLQILFLITIIALAPAILIMMTSFTRIIVVLAFIRNALGTHQMPPNQVLIGLALFLTFFVMSPVLSNINEHALQPYLNGNINQQEALSNALTYLREFMFKQTREKDLALFVKFAQLERVSSLDDIPTHVLIPGFIISELKTAFQMGFIIYIPFLVIDMIVASTLMSMGMLMLPPAMISLPFKVLLFIMVDGWNLVVRSLLLGFN